jgi:hypothetical protein
MEINKPKLVISGSARFREKISFWKTYFEEKGYQVIATPEAWDATKDFEQQLTKLFKDFYSAIDVCDVFFLVNEDKDDIKGYIGANGTAELIYVTMLNIRHHKSIDIYISKAPNENVLAYDEVTSFLITGWIKVYDEKS